MNPIATETATETATASAKPKLLVSACLLGTPCRYDGKSKPVEAVKALAKHFELLPFCPEQAGGLPTPRIPSEVQPDGTVKNRSGADVTKEYRSGAEKALELSRKEGCIAAILKEKSPACGHGQIYDGSFTKTLCQGNGICAALLLENGIPVFGESQAEDPSVFLSSADKKDP